MYKKIVTLLVYLITNQSFGQSATFLTQDKINVLSIVVQNNYYFNSGNYIPYTPNDVVQYSAYATMQARYDRGHSIVSAEYWKLKNLELINKQNIAYLNNYKNSRIKWVDTNIKSADLGKQEVLNVFIKNLCEIYDRPEIKNEISLLKSCHDELNRIKRNDPDNFIYSKRYRAIVSVLSKLENISPSLINTLSWESEELNEVSKRTEANKNVYSSTETPRNESNVSTETSKNEANLNGNARKPLFYWGYEKRSNNAILINKIEVNDNATIIYLTHTAPSEYINGGWVSIDPNVFLRENSSGRKLKLIKAEGIPLSPDKFQYSSAGQKLSFRLYFPRIEFSGNNVDLIECERDESCFNFYKIGTDRIIKFL